MAELFANNEDPDQTSRSVASDLGLHYSAITLLGVSRLQWVKQELKQINWLVMRMRVYLWMAYSYY